MTRELKETMLKEVKEGTMMMSHQTERNLKKETNGNPEVEKYNKKFTRGAQQM